MLQILPLRDYPEAIPVAAQWRFDQWGHEIPDSSLETFTQFLRQGLRKDGCHKRGSHCPLTAS